MTAPPATDQKPGPDDGAPGQGIKYSFRALKHRDFLVFWLGALVSNTGAWLASLAVPFVLYQSTGSAVWVGLASAAQFVPGMLLGPWAGALADRFNRRKVLLLTQTGTALAALSLWATWVSGHQDPVALLALICLIGVFNGLNMPAWQSFVNDLVPRRDLLSAVTLNSLQFNAARSLGPAIAGLLLATLGPSWAFLLNGCSFVFVIVALLMVRVRIPAPTAGPDRSVLRQFLQALRYVGRQRSIVVGILLSVSVGLFGNPLFTLTVVFAEDVFSVDPVGLGLMNAALGVGGILAAPVVSGWSRSISLAQVAAWGMLIFGLSMIWFGFTTNYVVALLALVVVGACFLAVISAVNTSIQLIVADHMRGRVMAVRQIFYTASFPIGALLQGALADLWGVQLSVVLAGAGLILTALAIMLVRGFESLNAPQGSGGPAA